MKKTINQVYNEFSAKEADELDTSEIQALRDKYDEVGPSVLACKKLGVPAVLSISNYHFSASAEDVLGGKTMESNREDLYSKAWSEEELLEEARVLELLYGADSFSQLTLTVCMLVVPSLIALMVCAALVRAVLPAAHGDLRGGALLDGPQGQALPLLPLGARQAAC